MTVDDFTASADLSGRRVSLRWTMFPESDSTTARTTVHRKERDFTFPADAAPFLIYDSEAFPPAPVPGRLEVTRLPDAVGSIDGLRAVDETVSVARVLNLERVEILRRTTRTVARQDGTIVRREVELLDAGGNVEPGTFESGRTYYYQLDVSSDPPAALHASATPTAVYDYGRALYEALPAAYRSRDTATRPTDEGQGLPPQSDPEAGQLRRLVDVFAAPLAALRSSADGLRGLRDVDLTDSRFLPLLAHWIGWDLAGDDIARQRNEISAAPSRYHAIGTLGGVREIVDHHTGWAVRIGESAQNISVTNTPPQRNVFAVQRSDGTWRPPDDAAAVLGLSGQGAQVRGTEEQPFELMDGMSLWLGVDRAAPVRVRFTRDDFADIAAATAAEVVSSIARTVRSVDAAVDGGKRVLLRSQRPGDAAQVAVASEPASLVTPEGAPRGRLSTTSGAVEHEWVAYATTGPGGALSLRIKPRLVSRWYDALPIGSDSESQADPAIVVLPERMWCAWVSDPKPGRSRLRYRLGAVADRTSARLIGDPTAPFRLETGADMVIVGSFGKKTFTVKRDDYANPRSATIDEVVTAMNRDLAGTIMAAPMGGALVLTTVEAGPNASMWVDLKSSTAARALGFGQRELTARGEWDPTIDWSRAHTVAGVPIGTHADCTAVSEPDGAIRLCWSTHDSGEWRLVTNRWTEHVLAATPSGLKMIVGGAVTAVTAADGLPSNDVRDAVTDADGTIWIATAAGAASRIVDAAVTSFTKASTGGGLAADDVRSAAVGPDGTVWFATSAGVSARAPDGSWRTFAGANLMPSNDVRDVVSSFDGTIWVATSKGIAVRRDLAWRRLRVADDHPTLDTRRLISTADGAIWAATGAGVVRIESDDTMAVFDLADLAEGAANVRDLATDGTSVWLATEAGVVEMGPRGDDFLYAAEDGIADTDCRAITEADGEIYVGTATKLFVRTRDGRWAASAASGLTAVRALHGRWSAPAFIADNAAGERDPHLVLDGDTLLLASARRTRGTTDTWRIALRRREAGSATWSAVAELTPSGAVDREPTLARCKDERLEVFFRSNRGGGARIWRLEVDDAGSPSAPAVITTSAGSDTNPAALVAGTELLLLFRSDRNLAMAGVADVPETTSPQALSVRRFAGATTVVPADKARNMSHDMFGDLLDYTPQRPRGDAPLPTERYTAGTVTVFFDRGRADGPLQPGDDRRLLQLLGPYLPANIRIVAIANL